MAYQTTVDLNALEGKSIYKNQRGEHQCVALVQAVTAAVPTSQWKRGIRVLDAKPGDIPVGTVIATFDADGKYPLTARHAAIYVAHNDAGIEVYDQWVKQKMVKKRTLRLKNLPIRDVNDAKYYYVVE
ncbi:MAG: BPSL0067 family protein [Saprospirales bacterium]|jgi:hypothetical protein|nr:BPSL0067 family protein [Saprospirales bacterium]MBK8921270.1 BPSL0067 family protein [Saprospirales bacterium]